MVVLITHKQEGMGKFTHLYLALLACFALIVFLHAQDQSGFISLDCGLPENSNYTEQTTGLFYTSDASFIDNGIGVSKSISPEFTKSSLQQQLWNVRSFPQGIRNCYSIKLIAGDRYLIRGTFMYGNYDDQGKIPEFDLHLGVEKWDSVELQNASDIIYKEIIHVPSSNHIHVCLLNTGHGTPFISALEVRPLNNNTYATKSGSLTLLKRLDFGTVTNKTFRYKDDSRDRIWRPYTNNEWTPLITSLPIDSLNRYEPPPIVLSTAATPKNASAPLTYQLEIDNSTSKFYIYMHFSEVIALQDKQYRAFDVYLNRKHWHGPVVPTYLGIYTILSTSPVIGGTNVFSIEKTQNSTLPPIINAIEVYKVMKFLQSETNQADVDAVMKIKSMYGVTRNWQGDPCAPQANLWDGLQCSNDGTDPPRIISLNLSSSGLTGEIALSIFNIKMLQILDLSNNSLTGPVPDFLSQLPSLTILNLERNKLTGSVPISLIERSKNGSLSILSVGGNTKLCSSLSCKKKNNIIVPVVASVVGGFFILLLTTAAIFWSLKRRKQGLATTNAISNNQYEFLDSRKRKFTYSDILRITNNFERVLGRGGFGAVYHGCIDDTHVAVKMLSSSSVQGYQQFYAEVELLMRVHHRNLTSLVGYCNEGTNIGLIYEYMANGDLASHLSDGDSKANILSWEGRVCIALDAAQGLEYLHNGCKPPIIHRDVKCTNILLNEDFHAKLADFGLSKSFPTDSGTHMSTVVAGTPGYLDPEYYIKNWLTDKSDVYSFGVVLLKIITSQPVIAKDQEKTHIIHWVSFMLAKGDINKIIDPKLHGDFEINSVWKAVEVAMACVSQTSIKRPTMSQVVVELKECLSIELARKQGREAELRDPVELFSVNSISELNPSPR